MIASTQPWITDASSQPGMVGERTGEQDPIVAQADWGVFSVGDILSEV